MYFSETMWISVANIQRFTSVFYHQSGTGQFQEPVVKSTSLIFHGIPTRTCWFLCSPLLGHSGSFGLWWTSVVRIAALPMPNMAHQPSLPVPFNCCMVTWSSPVSLCVFAIAQRSDSCASEACQWAPSKLTFLRYDTFDKRRLFPLFNI